MISNVKCRPQITPHCRWYWNLFMFTKVLLIGEKLVILRAGLGLAWVGLALLAISWAGPLKTHGLWAKFWARLWPDPVLVVFFSKIKICATTMITKVDHGNHCSNHCGYHNGYLPWSNLVVIIVAQILIFEKKLLGLGQAKAWPKIWPASHGFWVAQPRPGWWPIRPAQPVPNPTLP